MQRRGGTARHDAVAWGYARAASSLGVDIIQNCEVEGLVREGNRIVAVDTSRGRIKAGQVGIAVAGNTGRLAAMAGLRLPIESHVLQAFVSEPLKPILNTVVTYGAGHFYISQSDKGELVMGETWIFTLVIHKRVIFQSLRRPYRRRCKCFPCCLACACSGTGAALWT